MSPQRLVSVHIHHGRTRLPGRIQMGRTRLAISAQPLARAPSLVCPSSLWRWSSALWLSKFTARAQWLVHRHSGQRQSPFLEHQMASKTRLFSRHRATSRRSRLGGHGGAPGPHEVFGFVPYWSLGQSNAFSVAGLTTLDYFSSSQRQRTLNQSGPGWNGYESQALSP